ncbi:phosphate acetyltransferase [Candidatus Woesearchaeota archaeon]|nr:phosphate acetyltransferase [Candidatus Woesearchaeota archaeon]
MQDFLSSIKAQARKNPKRIVLAEPQDQRVQKAVRLILAEKTAMLLLVGDAKHNPHLPSVPFIDPARSPHRTHYTQILYRLRRQRGMTREQAAKLMFDPVWYGTMMVHLGAADGLVSGVLHTTADTLRPALQIIGTHEKFHKVSGVFFMLLKKKKLLLFADAAVNIDPDAKDLACIAMDTAKTAKKFGLVPKIAMLSFSTNGSAVHPLVEKVREATRMVKYKCPSLKIEGEMQVDAAIVPEVCRLKFPQSAIKGDANVLIFPDLQSGNISYKLVERFGHAKAVGPVLQGLQKPVNDLSRGCSAQDIVDIVAITVREAQRVNP